MVIILGRARHDLQQLGLGFIVFNASVPRRCIH